MLRVTRRSVMVRCGAFKHTHTSVSISLEKRTKKPIYFTNISGIIAYPSLIEMSRVNARKNNMFSLRSKNEMKLRYAYRLKA